MKGRENVSKENCQAEGSLFHKRFIRDFCGCVDGLLQSDIFGLFPSSFSMVKSLQRFLYDFTMLIP